MAVKMHQNYLQIVGPAASTFSISLSLWNVAVVGKTNSEDLQHPTAMRYFVHVRHSTQEVPWPFYYWKSLPLNSFSRSHSRTATHTHAHTRMHKKNPTNNRLRRYFAICPGEK